MYWFGGCHGGIYCHILWQVPDKLSRHSLTAPIALLESRACFSRKAWFSWKAWVRTGSATVFTLSAVLHRLQARGGWWHTCTHYYAALANTCAALNHSWRYHCGSRRTQHRVFVFLWHPWQTSLHPSHLGRTTFFWRASEVSWRLGIYRHFKGTYRHFSEANREAKGESEDRLEQKDEWKQFRSKESK